MSAWKNLERREAARQNTTRIWRQDFSEVKPDGETSEYIWDCKYRKAHAAISTYVRCEKKYHNFAAGRRFYLVLHSSRHRGDFVLIRAEEFHRLRRP